MVFVTWWLMIIVVALAAGAFIGLRYIWRRMRPKNRLAMANSFRLVRLPMYQKMLSRYTIALWVMLVLLAVTSIVGMLLSGRPTAVTATEPEMRNRDIMLCLDVSGSMYRVDRQVAKVFSEMAKGFKGERIGLVVFDSTASTVFPLTNDYDYASRQLQDMSDNFKKAEDGDYSALDDTLRGTYERDGASAIGDGLASCLSRFDKLDTKRSRSVVLATDNYLNTHPIVTLAEAGAMAKARQVRLYGVNPADDSDYYQPSKEAVEFKRVVLDTGGDYHKLRDGDASLVPSVIKKITEQEATRFKGTPQLMYTDIPAVFVYISLVALIGVMVIGWRYKI